MSELNALETHDENQEELDQKNQDLNNIFNPNEESRPEFDEDIQEDSVEREAQTLKNVKMTNLQYTIK